MALTISLINGCICSGPMLRSNAASPWINASVDGLVHGYMHNRGGACRRPWQGPDEYEFQIPHAKTKNPLRVRVPAMIALALWVTLFPRLRASLRVHDQTETPSTITLKRASTIAEIRSQ